MTAGMIRPSRGRFRRGWSRTSSGIFSRLSFRSFLAARLVAGRAGPHRSDTHDGGPSSTSPHWVTEIQKYAYADYTRFRAGVTLVGG